MIECPECGHGFEPGTLLCSECGAALSPDVPLPTFRLPREELPPSQIDTWLRTVNGYENAELPATATALRITVVSNGREVLFPLPLGEISVGRPDVSRGTFPDLDLDPDGGTDEGVSRHHAMLYQVGDYLFVEDACSSNGTMLNNRRINPYLPYPLPEGTTLQLGKLKLLVEFD